MDARSIGGRSGAPSATGRLLLDNQPIGFYDSLLAKVIVRGANRAAAIDRMVEALAAFKVAGVPTTIPFHLDMLRSDDFRAARVHTGWVDERVAETPAATRVSA
jgi:acetyl/propionyl-CoA carboxylase alpha subunit